MIVKGYGELFYVKWLVNTLPLSSNFIFAPNLLAQNSKLNTLPLLSNFIFAPNLLAQNSKFHKMEEPRKLYQNL